MFSKKIPALSLKSRLFRKMLFVYPLLVSFLLTECAGTRGREQRNTPYMPMTGIDERARAYDKQPGKKHASLRYAESLKKSGRLSEALAVLRKASLFNKADPDVAGAYGKVLASAGYFEEAAKVLANAHTPDRPNWRLLSAQGAVQDQLGRHARARQFYKNALLLAPDEPTILSNLGLSYALTEELEKAEEILSRAATSPDADARVRANLDLVRNLKANLSSRKKEGGAKETAIFDIPQNEAFSDPQSFETSSKSKDLL